jgi:hypothetical protein
MGRSLNRKSRLGLCIDFQCLAYAYLCQIEKILLVADLLVAMKTRARQEGV